MENRWKMEDGKWKMENAQRMGHRQVWRSSGILFSLQSSLFLKMGNKLACESGFSNYHIFKTSADSIN